MKWPITELNAFLGTLYSWTFNADLLTGLREKKFLLLKYLLNSKKVWRAKTRGDYTKTFQNVQSLD